MATTPVSLISRTTKMHEMLKSQHKGVVDAVREGRVADVLNETYGLAGNGFSVAWSQRAFCGAGRRSGFALPGFTVRSAGEWRNPDQ